MRGPKPKKISKPARDPRLVDALRASGLGHSEGHAAHQNIENAQALKIAVERQARQAHQTIGMGWVDKPLARGGGRAEAEFGDEREVTLTGRSRIAIRI